MKSLHALTGNGDAPIRVIALDCDGVLFDSREANIQFYTHILKTVGRPPVRPEDHDYIHMYPVRESLRHLLGEGESFDRAMDYFQKIDFEAFNGYLRCEPGLVDFLTFAKANYKTALATNRTVSTLELLEHYHLREYFDLVVCASDVRFPKPHPEIMLRILDEFGATPKEVLYVGDSQVDATVAEETGVVFAAYKNPGLKAHYHITHFQQLYPLFAPPGPSAAG